MSEPTWVGKVLGGRYRLDALLGQGGMSAVYKATDPNLRRTVAVKLIHSHLTGDPEFVRRFEVEASAVAQLHHPNIIQVYDFNLDGETYYMVLEFVPGESLDRRLRRLAAEGARIPATLAAEIAGDIADALDYAHGQGLIHRDIKPANIMLGERGQTVLMDFGVAKIVGATQYTASGALVGTAFYISPEQVRGEPPSARSDIYALGVSLFEMLAGRPPFTGDSAMSVMLKHINEPVPDLRRIAPETPAALIQVVEVAMAKDPRQRFTSGRDMVSALDRVKAGLAASRTDEKHAAAGRSGPTAATVIDEEPLAAAAARPISLPAAPEAARSGAPAKPLLPAQPAAPPAASSNPSAASSTATPAVSAAPGTPAHRGGRTVWLAAGAVAALLCLVVGGTAALGGVLALPFVIATQPPSRPAGTPVVLFQDDFSNPASGWTIASGPKGEAKYDQGEYVMQVTVANWQVWSTSASGDQTNTHVEVTAASTGQATDEAFGLMCGYTDESHYYVLGLNLNGYYAIIKFAGGTTSVLTDDRGQWLRSIRIAPRAPSYRIGADCAADGTLALYADGQQIAVAKDKTFAGGTLGLFVRTFYQSGAEVRYRDFVVTALR